MAVVTVVTVVTRKVILGMVVMTLMCLNLFRYSDVSINGIQFAFVVARCPSKDLKKYYEGTGDKTINIHAATRISKNKSKLRFLNHDQETYSTSRPLRSK